MRMICGALLGSFKVGKTHFQQQQKLLIRILAIDDNQIKVENNEKKA